MPTSFTTTLPDELQPDLNNGVKDEITVERNDERINNGLARFQIRQTGETAWDSSAAGFGETAVAFNAGTALFSGLLDGLEYEVRGRTETEYVTGAWTEPVAVVTAFPGADNLAASATGTTTVEITWDEYADNEEGQLVIRERREAGGTPTYGAERVLEDVGPDTESYTDTDAQPGTEYRYRVRAYTPFAEADSNTDTTETDAIGERRVATPASGPVVRIDGGDGDELQPRILDVEDATGIVNEMPRLRVTVPADERWQGLEGHDARAWRDGVRLPVDEVADVDRGPETYELELRGASQLDRYAEGDQVEWVEELSHVAAGEVIDELTDYASSVDDPESEQRADVPFQNADNQTSFEDVLVDYPFAADEPVELGVLGELETLDIGWFEEAVDMIGDGVVNSEDTPDNWPNGEVVQIGTFEERRMSFSSEHDIPGEAWVSWAFACGGDNPEIVLEADIDNTGSWESLDVFPAGSSGTDSNFDFRLRSAPLTTESETLEAGTHRMRFRTRGGGDTDIYLGWAFPHDRRWDISTPTDVSGGVVEGWEQKPEAVEVRFEPVSSIEQVTGGVLDVDVDEATGLGLGLRNAPNADWETGTNADRLEVAFAEPGQLLQGRVTLGRYDSSGDAPGTFGDASNVVSAFELLASLDDTPVILDKSYRGSIEEILNRIRESGDFIWAAVWDDSLETDDPDGGVSIEWTSPGQREQERDLDLVEWGARKSIEDRADRVIVYGANRTVRDERFEANDPGLAIGLDQEHIEPGSETVTDPETDQEFSRGVDYSMRWADGGIAITEGGDMQADAEYAIEYDWETRGEYQLPGVDDPDTLRVEAPEASTPREAEQLALGIVKRVQDPLEEAEFELSARELPPGVSLVEVLSGDLPFETPMRIKEVDWSPSSIQGRSESRQQASEIVDELRDRLDSVSRRT